MATALARFQSIVLDSNVIQIRKPFIVDHVNPYPTVVFLTVVAGWANEHKFAQQSLATNTLVVSIRQLRVTELADVGTNIV